MTPDQQPPHNQAPNANLLNLPTRQEAEDLFQALNRTDLEQIAVMLLCEPQPALDAGNAHLAKEQLWGCWQTAQAMAAKRPDDNSEYLLHFYLQDHISQLEAQLQRVPRHWSDAISQLENLIREAKECLAAAPAPPRPDFPETTPGC